MERDHIDEGLREPRAPVPERTTESTGPDGAHLPTALGNSAFTRVVQRAAAVRAQRTGGRSQGAGPLDPAIARDIEQARGGGAPVPAEDHEVMRSSMGADFSHVRIHTDARADSLSRSVQAEAFTTGTDVFFRAGAYTPGSSGGRRLLAHELTHVVQQGSGQVEGGRVSHPDDAHEVEARSVGDTVAAAPTPAATAAGATAAVAREAVPEEEEEAPVQAAVARQEVPEEEEPEEAPVQAAVARQEVPEEEEEPETSPAG